MSFEDDPKLTTILATPEMRKAMEGQFQEQVYTANGLAPRRVLPAICVFSCSTCGQRIALLDPPGPQVWCSRGHVNGAPAVAEIFEVSVQNVRLLFEDGRSVRS